MTSPLDGIPVHGLAAGDRAFLIYFCRQLEVLLDVDGVEEVVARVHGIPNGSPRHTDALFDGTDAQARAYQFDACWGNLSEQLGELGKVARLLRESLGA